MESNSTINPEVTEWETIEFKLAELVIEQFPVDFSTHSPLVYDNATKEFHRVRLWQHM